MLDRPMRVRKKSFRSASTSVCDSSIIQISNHFKKCFEKLDAYLSEQTFYEKTETGSGERESDVYLLSK
jgi:hypothetical protein